MSSKWKLLNDYLDDTNKLVDQVDVCGLTGVPVADDTLLKMCRY